MDNRRSASTTKTHMKLYNSEPFAVEPKQNQHIAPFGHTPYIKIHMKLMKFLISSLWLNKNKRMGINRSASTTKTQMKLYNSALFAMESKQNQHTAALGHAPYIKIQMKLMKI